MFKETVKVNKGVFDKKYNLELLPGVYFYRIQSGKYSVVKKFIVE